MTTERKEGGVEEQDAREEQGAKEEQTLKIDAIVGEEVLGYDGTARGEHSGQDSAREGRAGDDLEGRLADNRPEQVE